MGWMIRRVFFLALSGWFSAAHAYTLDISESELQEKVAAMMPMELKKLFLTAILSNPKVELHGGANEISVFSDIDVLYSNGYKKKGSLLLTGSLSYQPASSSFFLQNVKVAEIKVDSLPETYLPAARNIADFMVKKMFATYPVYTLKNDSIKNSIAKSLLQTVSVENKKLVLVFGLFPATPKSGAMESSPILNFLPAQE